ncbi:MAG: methylenetetrahydrofolate reductase [NAD(P)H] [Rikenellaceae bacterium]|nr:methylenetetrahydrofolate reductase [NAD(P)H] [Rikenellaceae bacterium]
MQVKEIIAQAQSSGKARFSFELLPPLKGDGTDKVFEAIDTLRDYNPAFIHVTFHRELVKSTPMPDGTIERHIDRHRPGTVGISAAIKARYGIDTVPHLICGGHSKYDIEDALIDMDFLGLDTLMALRGDAMKGEPHFVPHPQGHAYAVDLVRQISAMNRGEFLDPEEGVSHHSNFCIGVAGYPEKHGDSPSVEEDIRRLKEKVDAGADYIITQMFFDNSKFFEFVERCRKVGINVPIIPGIKPMSTLKHLEVLPRIFWCHLPDELRRRASVCTNNADMRKFGVEWASEQSAELIAAGIPVIHYYSMGRTDNVAQIVSNVF